MKHMILAKFNDAVTDKSALLAPIRRLFAGAVDIPGVRGAAVYPCCVQRDNRYDVMIVLDMDASALPAYDESQMHRTWKERFGALLQKKAVFDYEDA